MRMMVDITPSELFTSLFHQESGYFTKRNDIGHLKEHVVPFCLTLSKWMKDEKRRIASSKDVLKSVTGFKEEIRKRTMGGGYHKMISISLERNLDDLCDTLLTFDGVEKDSGYMRRWFLDPLRRIMKNPKNAMFLYPVVAVSGKREDYSDYVPFPICLVEIYSFLMDGAILHEGHLRFLLDTMCSNVKLYTVNSSKDVYRHAGYLSSQISKEFDEYIKFSSLDSPSAVSPWNLQPVRSLIYHSLFCASSGRRRRVMRLLKRIDQRRVGTRIDGSMELELDKLSDETIVHLSDYMTKWGEWKFVCEDTNEEEDTTDHEYLSEDEREEKEREIDEENDVDDLSSGCSSSSSRCGSSCFDEEDYFS